MLQKVGILPTFVYFHPKGLFVKYGNTVYFDPTHWPDFSIGVRKQREFGLKSFIEIVVASLN